MSRLKAIVAPVAGFLALMALGALAPGLGRVLDLALPFFGLILVGFVAGKAFDIPEAGLQWMHTFIVYVALPALFFNLISVTPISELANVRFIAVTSACTLAAFAAGFLIGWRVTGGRIEEATIQGVAGGYSNVGYMGPGLTLATFGPASVAPTALIFTFDSAIFFTLAPFLMGLAGGRKASVSQTALEVARRVFLHPFNIAIALGVLAAWAQWRPPVALDKMLGWLQGAAAPSALFVMGVTVALRAVGRCAPEAPALLLVKLVAHPLLVWGALTWVGGVSDVWIKTAVLMAALPPALNVFVLARQYDAYVERASSIVMAGTVASVFTVTALLYAFSGAR
ncbi:MAG: AEC family transporter [Beijerinckiaceae bacterium]